jgi:Family of unknown function (DUF6064)
MTEWWTYAPEDFLLFSPRVYWRMFELHNAAVWPSQALALLVGAAILVWVVRPKPWSGRAVSIGLAAAWIWVAWTFLWHRYSLINWSAIYAVPAFVLEALLLVWFGTRRDHLDIVAPSSVSQVIGLTLLVYALVLHPFVAILVGRPFQASEAFGIAPDPTAMATLGIATMAARHTVAWMLLPVPLLWCFVSWLTLKAMEAPEAWIRLGAAGLAVVAQFWPSNTRRDVRSS